MDLRPLTVQHKSQYNQKVNHIVQSWEWGEFRKKLGLPVYRFGLFTDKKLETAFQLDLHQIPFLKKNIGYLPKGPLPTKEFIQALEEIGHQYNCTAIKLEPNVTSDESDKKLTKLSNKLITSKKTLFAKHNFLLDLSQTEEELLKNMHQKTRYNIRVAQKHGVWVEARDDEEALNIYLQLYFATCQRQGYFGHNEHYHRLAWKTLNQNKMAKILIAFYQPDGTKHKIALACWMLFNFKETLYYPYGGSSTEYKNVMAPTLLAWEAIRYGKKLGLKEFDMWGAINKDAGENHPWQGFTRFKEGFGAKPVEYLGTYDLVFNSPLFQAFTLIDQSTKLKSMLLKLIGK